jgi:hypothetical protein
VADDPKNTSPMPVPIFVPSLPPLAAWCAPRNTFTTSRALGITADARFDSAHSPPRGTNDCSMYRRIASITHCGICDPPALSSMMVPVERPGKSARMAGRYASGMTSGMKSGSLSSAHIL